MGQEDSARFGVSENGVLIDFLYVDKERADSLISQIRNGTLRSVTKTVGTSEGSLISGKAEILGTGGAIEMSNRTKEEAAQQYDPNHSQLLELLNDLNLKPLFSLPALCEGELSVLRSRIAIRDVASMKAIIPMVLKHQAAIFGRADKEMKETLKISQELLAQMPDSISLSLSVDGVGVDGVLKETGLSIKRSDLTRMYGTNIPGEWFILGILDNAPSARIQAGVDSIESAIDFITSATQKFYSSAPYKIVPILIYRAISYK